MRSDAIVALWMLLDDIDTLDDACKSDDAAFRKLAYEIQRRRFEIVTGEEIDALAQPEAVKAKPVQTVGKITSYSDGTYGLSSDAVLDKRLRGIGVIVPSTVLEALTPPTPNTLPTD